jgi:hypothetical protein
MKPLPWRHRVGIGDAQRQLVLQQHLAALAGVAAEAEGLQVAEVVGTALVAGHDGVPLQGPQVRSLLTPAVRKVDTLLRQFQREVLAVREEGLNSEALPRSPGP